MTNDDSQRSTVAVIKQRAAIRSHCRRPFCGSGGSASGEVEVDTGEHSGMVTEFLVETIFVDRWTRPWVYEIGASRNPLATNRSTENAGWDGATHLLQRDG